MPEVTKTITGADEFTDPIEIEHDVLSGRDRLDASIKAGTFAATITVQRRFAGETTWRDLDPAFTAAVERIVDTIATGTQHRIGVKAGDFTSGTIEVRMGY